MVREVECKVTIGEGKKITKKIVIGKNYTDLEWEQKEKEKWEKANK